jgi:hypothetical protein
MKRIALASPPDRPAKDPQKSRVGNGSVLLPGVDGRSAWSRRAKDVLSETPHWYCLSFSNFLGATHNSAHYRLWY